MTIAEARSRARRYARIDTSWTSGDGTIDNEHVNELIQDAVRQFTNDVGGFPEQAYAQIDERFDTQTYFAIRVTITGGTNALAATDVAITGTARTETTGAIVAADFQTTLRAAIGVGANATVTYADFSFTVDTVNGTAIEFAAPTTAGYADAREMLGLSGTITEAEADHTGSFPQGCTMRYTIPTDAMHIEHIEWDDYALAPLPREYAMNTRSQGEPAYYHVRGRTLYFVPSPNQQGICRVWYRGQPADIDFDEDIDLPTEIPESYHKAIAYHVAAQLLLEQMDNKYAGDMHAQYARLVRQFRVARGSNDTSPDDPFGPRQLRYRVTM